MEFKALFLFLFATFLLSATSATVSTPPPATHYPPAVKTTPPPPPTPPVKLTPPPPPPKKTPTPSPAPAVPVKPPSPAVKPPAVKPTPPFAPPPPRPPRNTQECYPLCVERCKLHSRNKVCMRACVTCCDRCKCVPPGTYGNYDKCPPCYANMTTRGGRRKCP